MIEFGEPELKPCPLAETGGSRMKWDIGTPCYAQIVEWKDTDFECPDCGGVMQRHNNVTCTSNPPMYEYRCKKCGAIHYRFQ